jgi:hypothetical protein
MNLQQHPISDCASREAAKLSRFLLTRYGLVGVCNIPQKYTFFTIKERFPVCSGCGDVAKLHTFLATQCISAGTCNSSQNCTFRDCKGKFYRLLDV